MPKENPLVTCFAKGFRQGPFIASRKLKCRILAIYPGVFSARIKLDRTAKYPGLGYDVQRKIEARGPPTGRLGTVAEAPENVAEVQSGLQRGSTDDLRITISADN